MIAIEVLLRERNDYARLYRKYQKLYDDLSIEYEKLLEKLDGLEHGRTPRQKLVKRPKWRD